MSNLNERILSFGQTEDEKFIHILTQTGAATSRKRVFGIVGDKITLVNTIDGVYEPPRGESVSFPEKPPLKAA
jgi:hypothetical protein